VVVRRTLTDDEVDLLTKLTIASDLYSGGHVGNSSQIGSEGPWQL